MKDEPIQLLMIKPNNNAQRMNVSQMIHHFSDIPHARLKMIYTTLTSQTWYAVDDNAVDDVATSTQM